MRLASFNCVERVRSRARFLPSSISTICCIRIVLPSPNAQLSGSGVRAFVRRGGCFVAKQGDV